MKLPSADYSAGKYLERYLNVCAIRRNEIAIDLSKAQEHIAEAKEELTPNIDKINDLAEVCIEDSIEYTKEQVVENSLTEQLITSAIFKAVKAEDREVLKTAIKYFNALREYNDCKNKILHIDNIVKRFKAKGAEFRKILYHYYGCGFTKCLTEGYGYKFNNNLGYVMIKNIKDGKKQRLDWAKTNANKKKFQELGYELKTKDNPNGVDYRVYIRVEQHKELFFFGQFFNNSDFCIELTEYVGKTLVNAREQYKNAKNPQEILSTVDTSMNFKAKLSLCLEKFPGLRLKYNRGDYQKYKAFIKNKTIKVKYRNE